MRPITGDHQTILLRRRIFLFKSAWHANSQSLQYLTLMRTTLFHAYATKKGSHVSLTLGERLHLLNSFARYRFLNRIPYLKLQNLIQTMEFHTV